MKNIFLISLMIFTIISCKRKQNLRDLDGKEILAKGPTTCYNFIKDGDEVGVDCGGSCGNICDIDIAPCSPVNKTFKIGTSTLNLTPQYSTPGGSSYVFLGSYTGGYEYRIELGYTVTPDTLKAYKIRDYNPGTKDARVYLTASSFGATNFDFYLNSGKVYVKKIGSRYSATICDAQGYYISNTSVFIPVEAKTESY